MLGDYSKKILLAAAATILLLALAEVAARAVGLRAPGFEPFPPHLEPGLMIPHPTRG